HIGRAGHGSVSPDHFILYQDRLLTLTPALIKLYGPDLFLQSHTPRPAPLPEEAGAHTPPAHLPLQASATITRHAYSLGLRIYHLITGPVPPAPARGHSAIDPSSGSEAALQSMVDEGPVLDRLTRALARATNWNHEERWADLAVFAEGLTQILAARPPGP